MQAATARQHAPSHSVRLVMPCSLTHTLLTRLTQSSRREADYDEEDDYAGYGEEEDVGQQGLQPTKEDPGLFMVTCRCGARARRCLCRLRVPRVVQRPAGLRRWLAHMHECARTRACGLKGSAPSAQGMPAAAACVQPQHAGRNMPTRAAAARRARRIGAEREACLQLLQKCYNMAERGTPLAIKSAVCLDHVKGFFYVEAFRDSHVRRRA